MNILRPPDDLTRAAFRRLAGSDPDFRHVLNWLEDGLKDLDERNRVTLDAAMLRIGQGAARALSDIVNLASDRSDKQALARPPAPVVGFGGQ